MPNNITPEQVEELRRLEAKLPPAPWELWTSCSYRRITGPDGKVGGVLHAYNQRGDGQPDLSMPEDQLQALVDIRNALPALLDLASAAGGGGGECGPCKGSGVNPTDYTCIHCGGKGAIPAPAPDGGDRPLFCRDDEDPVEFQKLVDAASAESDAELACEAAPAGDLAAVLEATDREMTTRLANGDWKPTRSHYERIRNTVRRLAALSSPLPPSTREVQNGR